MIEIIEVNRCTQSQFEELRELISQLTSRHELTREALQRVLEHPDCQLYVILEQEHILGCATLCLYHSPTGTKASVEDVVVHSGARGRGLGRMLMQRLLLEARKFAPITLTLTSRPSRTEANMLYQSLGFKRRETNCYSLEIEETN